MLMDWHGQADLVHPQTAHTSLHWCKTPNSELSLGRITTENNIYMVTVNCARYIKTPPERRRRKKEKR
jgi:hypothetical protein